MAEEYANWDMDGSATHFLCPLNIADKNNRLSLHGSYLQLGYRFISSTGQGDLVVSLLGVSGKISSTIKKKRPLSAFKYVLWGYAFCPAVIF